MSELIGQSVLEMQERIKELEAQNKALVESVCDQQDRASRRAKCIAALHRDLAIRENEYRILSDHSDEIEAENVALKEDKARLDRLEDELKDGHYPNIKVTFDYHIGISTLTATTRLPDVNHPYHVIQPAIRPALDKAFAAIDAARKAAR